MRTHNKRLESIINNSIRSAGVLAVLIWVIVIVRCLYSLDHISFWNGFNSCLNSVRFVFGLEQSKYSISPDMISDFVGFMCAFGLIGLILGAISLIMGLVINSIKTMPKE